MKYGEEIFQYLFKYNTIRFVVLMSSCIPDNPLENLLSVMSTKRKKTERYVHATGDYNRNDNNAI